jgi:hypothetical protein
MRLKTAICILYDNCAGYDDANLAGAFLRAFYPFR